MPLTFAKPSDSCRIVKITGRDATKKHLEHLGLVENETIQVLSSQGGSLIIQLRDSRLALDATMAGRIHVMEERKA